MPLTGDFSGKLFCGRKLLGTASPGGLILGELRGSGGGVEAKCAQKENFYNRLGFKFLFYKKDIKCSASFTGGFGRSRRWSGRSKLRNGSDLL